MNARPHRAGQSFRLSSAEEFQRVYSRRLRQDLGWIIVHGAANDLLRTRLGLSIGVRVGNATRRVKVKRMIREAFRLTRKDMPCGLDIVVSARAHDARPLADYKRALAEETRRLASRLGISDQRGE